jgi:hypothetical protein
LGLFWVKIGFELALIGFELALFLTCSKPPKYSYYLVIKELTLFFAKTKLGLFFQIHIRKA